MKTGTLKHGLEEEGLWNGHKVIFPAPQEACSGGY